MANKVIFGLKNVHVAFRDPTTGVWEVPAAVPGAVNLSLSGEGDLARFFADDGEYWSDEVNNGYTGELETALIPDAILARMLGWDQDANGMLVEVSDATREAFALMFEVSGNVANKRYAFYNTLAGRPGVDHQTKGETTEPKTTALPITITPVEINGVRTVKGIIERTTANAAVFDAFFGAVYEPDLSVS